MSDQSKVMVMVGTRKGGFIFTSDRDRKKWSAGEMLFKGWNTMQIMMDRRDQRLHAAVNHFSFGTAPHHSDDLGQTWKQAEGVPAFSRASKSGHPSGTVEEAFSGGPDLSKPEEVIKVWNITPGLSDEPNVLYAGVQPAALFKSTDRGESWSLVESLFDHPQRGQWNPGAGGLCLHTILLDPVNSDRMYVAISAAGVYRTDDGGKTWQPRNKNVRADFMGESQFPEFGQCVHKVAMHPSRPNVLYQQNHCGMYRSDNNGDDWIDIGEGRLPSRFGFPIAIHPNDPQTIFVIPEESDQFRMSLDGQFAVWRSRDAGETWQRQTSGLPQGAHLVVLRDALATDTLDPAGIYAGTDTGQLFYSRDEGETWEILAAFLPPIQSVKTAVVY
ncbi:MAG: exo-alpha-sialidase [Chloroflexi bacterium]|nr:exo-alpha-sialidase [Chloroflexota bacterium]